MQTECSKPQRRRGAPAGRLARPGLLWLGLLALLLAGCGSAPSRAAAPTATAPRPPSSPTVHPAATRASVASPVASPGTVRVGTAEIGAVVWATAVDPATKAPRQRVAAFPADARTIYATLPIVRITRGTTLAASWSYNDTPIPQLNSAVTAPADAENIWVEFHLTLKPGVAATPPLRPGTWPAGTYRVTISVNGTVAERAEVAVGKRAE